MKLFTKQLKPVLLLVTGALQTADAFHRVHSAFVPPFRQSPLSTSTNGAAAFAKSPLPTTAMQLQMDAELNPMDEVSIENVAEYCLHESCDIEDYEALVNQLEEQKSHMIRHVAEVESLLQRLKDANRPEYDPSEVGNLIDSIYETLENPVYQNRR